MDETDNEPDAVDVFLLGARIALLAVAIVTLLVGLTLIAAEFATGKDLVSPFPFAAVVGLVIANRLLTTQRARRRFVALILRKADR